MLYVAFQYVKLYTKSLFTNYKIKNITFHSYYATFV